MNPTIALLPSALLGPAVWQPVRERLRAAGRDVIVAGWSDRPAGYLAFGDAYQTERVTAESWGWRSAQLDGGHLHMLNAPGEVAAAIARLL